MSATESSWAESFGLKVGRYLGKRVVLGGCDETPRKPLPPRPFLPEIRSAEIPSGVDLRRWMPRVDDQGELAASGACALASAFEYLALREHRLRVDVSRLFLYFNQRLWAGSLRKNGGAPLADGVRVMLHLGVPLERLWPFQPGLFAVQPPEQVYRAAARHKITGYHQVSPDLLSLRACLAGGFPVAVALRIFPSLSSVGADGVYAGPQQGEPEQGSHGFLLVGYNDQEKLFVARNCWGHGWGDQGHGYLPYDYVASAAHTVAGWTLRSGEAAFDEEEHAQTDLARMPQAPPPAEVAPVSSVWGAFSRAAAARANPFEAAAIAATDKVDDVVQGITGSTAVGHFAGGIARALVPAVLKQGQKHDGGVLVGPDRSEEILAQLDREPEAAQAHRLSWDDGLDEASIFLPGVHRAQRSLDEPDETPAPAPEVSPSTAALPSGPAASASASEAATGAASASGAASATDYGYGLRTTASATGAATASATAAAAAAAAASASGAASGAAAATGAAALVPEEAPAWAPTQAALSSEEATLVRWNQLGGERGPMGLALAPERPMSDGVGRFTVFERGVIVWHPEKGAFDVRMPLLQLWSDSGAERGPLGYPISGEGPLDAAGRGRFIHFDRGILIDWGPDAQGLDRPPIALFRGDLLYERWLQLGADRSAFGWPIEPPRPLADSEARGLRCERGLLIEHPTHGVIALAGPVAAVWLSQGGPAGPLGHPTGDTRVDEDNGSPLFVTPFERATMAWSPERGPSYR